MHKQTFNTSTLTCILSFPLFGLFLNPLHSHCYTPALKNNVVAILQQRRLEVHIYIWYQGYKVFKISLEIGDWPKRSKQGKLITNMSAKPSSSCPFVFVTGSEKRDPFVLNVLLFKLSSHHGLKSLRLPTWFVGSIGLLLHRSNVRS